MVPDRVFKLDDMVDRAAAITPDMNRPDRPGTLRPTCNTNNANVCKQPSRNNAEGDRTKERDREKGEKTINRIIGFSFLFSSFFFLNVVSGW